MSREWQALNELTAVDGNLLRALPWMARACRLDKGHRAATMHVRSELLSGVPVL